MPLPSPTDNEMRLNEQQQIEYLMGNPPSWMMKYGITIIAAVIILLLLLSYFIQYPDVIETKVVLTTSNPPIRLIAQNGGQIVELLITSDQLVQENEGGIIKSKPVAMVSGCLPRVSAKFSKTASNQSCTIPPWVRAKWGETSLSPLIIQPTQLNNELELSPTKFEASFLQTVPKNSVSVFRFHIFWEYSEAENGPWHSSGQTLDTICFSRVKPLRSSGMEFQTPARFYSSIYYGCKIDGGGPLTTLSDIASTIFNSWFISTNITNADNPGGLSMEYWGPIASLSNFEWTNSVWYLLSNHDGRCGQFSDFLGDILSIQGISNVAISTPIAHQVFVTPFTLSSEFTGNTADLFETLNSYFGDKFDPLNPYNTSNKVYINSSSQNNPSAVFFVKNWDFSEGINKIYSFDHFGAPSLISPTGKEIFAADLSGVRGQGNSNPRAWFYEHGILEFNGEYFDPSYGSVVVPDKSNYVYNAFDGIGVLVTYTDSDGVPHDLFWLYSDEDSINPDDILFTN